MTRVAIDLFSGGGGSVLGLHRAGYTVHAYERDDDAVRTLHDAGFADVTRCDLSDPDVHAAMPGYADLMWCSPPCQPYSRAGFRRGAEDERDMVDAALAAVATARPVTVVFENSLSFVNHRDGGARVMRALAPLGYQTAVWKLNAADYGVAQDRKKAFIVGVHWTLQVPAPPPRQHIKVPMRAVVGDHLHDAERRAGNVARPNTRPSRTVTTKGNTMVWDDQQDRRRRLTVEESAALMGFPEGYPLHGSKRSQFRQLGNAVCPAVAQAIATQLGDLLP